MAFNIGGALRGVSEYMTGSRELDEQRQLQAHRKSMMDKEAFDLERSRAGAAQQTQMNQMGGQALGQMYPTAPPPQPPEPGQASVPSQPQVPGGMQQPPPHMGGQPTPMQPPGPPPIPKYQSVGSSGGIVLPPGNSAQDWNKINASYNLGKPEAASERMKILQQELQTETDPSNRASLLREIAKTGGQKMPPPDAGGQAPQQSPDQAGQVGEKPPVEQQVQMVAQKKVRDIMGETIEGFRKANVPQEQWLPLLASLKGPISMQFEQQLNEIKTQQEATKAAKDAHSSVIAEARLAQQDKLQSEQHAETKRHNIETEKLGGQRAETAALKAQPKSTGDMTKTGAEYLATLPQGLAGSVKAVAEGRQKLSDAGRSASERVALMEAVNHYNPDYNMPKNAATAGALNQNTKDLAMIRPYKEMLDTNVDVAIDLGKKIISSNSALANKSINWLKQNMGDNPDAAEYLAQIHFVQTESARVLNNPRLVGQLSVQAKKEMDEIVNGNMPINATERILSRIKKDGDNRVNALIKEHDTLLGEFGGKKSEVPVPESKASAPSTKSGPKPGTVEGGYRFKGGDPASKSSWEKV